MHRSVASAEFQGGNRGFVSPELSYGAEQWPPSVLLEHYDVRVKLKFDLFNRKCHEFITLSCQTPM